jgi:hypothetical protein
MWFPVTNPDGTHSWLREDACTEVDPVIPDEKKMRPSINCKIRVGGETRWIRESVDMIMTILRK